MIWTTWRQHRAEAAVGAVILAALVAAMLTVGTIARSRAHAGLEALHRDFHTIPPFTAALVAIPLMAGMFWAAPLVSREYEAGTHRLAWTQSVSPLRWITTKIALIFGVLALAALWLGLLATWTLDPLVPAFGGRYNSSWYDIQGMVPVACMLFALSVGVAASALIRRTIPAMAVTLLGYAIARIPVHWFRPHFAPVSTRTVTVPVSTLLLKLEGNPEDFAGSGASGDWVLHVRVTDSSGHPLDTHNGNLSVVQQYCPALNPTRAADGGIHVDADACRATIKALTIRDTVTYQPASHFWFIQAVESAIFLGLAVLFVTAAVLAVTRRRPT